MGYSSEASTKFGQNSTTEKSPGSGTQLFYNEGNTLDNLDIDNYRDFYDTFTNTNGTNLSIHNANYSYSGTVTIQSNAIVPNSTNVSISNNSFDDGCMSIDETNQTTNTNMMIRVQGSDGYQLIWWSNQWRLQGNYGGSGHTIASGSYNQNGTNTFEICAVGSTISAYLNGGLLGSGTDTGVTGSGTQLFYNEGNTLSSTWKI